MRSMVALSHSGELGGADRALLELLVALRGAAWKTCCVVPARGELADALFSRGIPTSIVPSQGWATSRTTAAAVAGGSATNLQAVPQTVAALPRLVALLGRLRPEVLVTNTITTPIGALAARVARVPHMTYAHEYGVDDHALLFLLGFGRSLRALSRLSSVFVANSEATSGFFSHLLGRPVPVVPYSMSLATRRLDPLTARPPSLRALVLARISEGKNQLECVRAVAAARTAGVPVTLHLVGRGDDAYRQRLTAEASRLGIGDVVVHHGHVDDPAAEIDAAHVLVVPSRREAFGRVTVEAMLRSRPVIAAANGASAELVQPGRTGLLYQAGDPEALAAALTTLWTGWDDTRDWSQRAYGAAATAFTEERTVAAFEQALAPGAPTKRLLP